MGVGLGVGVRSPNVTSHLPRSGTFDIPQRCVVVKSRASGKTEVGFSPNSSIYEPVTLSRLFSLSELWFFLLPKRGK